MRLRLLLKTTALAFFLLFSSKTSWGQALLVENFEFDAGNLPTNIWNVANTGNPVYIEAGSLSYTDYAASGIGNYAKMKDGLDYNKSVGSVTSGSIYASALIKVSVANAAADYFFHFTQSGTTFKGRVFVKSIGAGFSLGVAKTGTTPAVNFSSELTLNDVHLVVLKYTFNTGSSTDDIVELFIDPTVGLAEPSASVIASDNTTADATGITLLGLRQASTANASTLYIDGIRVATSWSEAVKLNTPPVATFDPANGSTTANPDGNITVTFDEKAFYTDGNPLTNPNLLVSLKETDASGADVPFNAVIDGSQTIITIDPTPVLDYNKTYYVSVAPVEDVVGKESLLQSATFTTRPQDVTAPEWTATYPKISSIANSDFNLLVNLNEAGKAYYVVLPDGGAIPTAAQVKAGTDGSDAPALKSGSISLSSGSTEYSANINGLAAGTIYDVYIVAEDIELTPNLQTATADLLNVTTTDTKPEPSNQATGLSVVVNDQTTVTFNWTDATGGQLPHSYLLLASETGTPADPADGIPAADGTYAVNVAYGAQTASLTGLTSGTHYFFKLFAYTNTGTAVDYLLAGAPAAEIDLPKLTFLYPNGGEIFYAGDTIELKWSSTFVTDVSFEHSIDNGATWQPWFGPVASDGADTVVIPSDAEYSNQYLLRIADASNSMINDATDSVYTVKAVTSSLVDLLTMPNNAIVKYTGKATVTYARTSRNQKYIQDETGAVLIDDNTAAPGFIQGTYAIGDGITNIEGTIVVYNGLIEFKPTFATGEPCTGNPVIVPETRTIESLTHLDQCKLVRIEGFSFATTGQYQTSTAFVASKNYDITGFANTVFNYRTLFSEADYIGTEIPLSPVTAVCIVGQFNTTMQITARNLADITSTAAFVTSDAYVVDINTLTISNVPEADDLAAFKANLIPAANATFEVYDADGITPATVLDATKKVIVTAQDGTTKTTYTIEITVYVPSSIASLTKLQYNGNNVNGFLSSKLDYAVLLPVGTSDIPVISYTLADAKANAIVTNATNLFGSVAERTSKVEVTAEDGTTIKTYTIVFTVDNTGIANGKTEKLSIYPVPAIDEITVSGLAKISRFEIMDITGKVLRNYEVTGDEMIIRVGELRTGMYFLRTANNTLKFIKK